MQENRANGRIMRSRPNIYILVPICTAILVAIYVSGRPTPADPPAPGGGDETTQQTDQTLDEDTNMAATFSEIEANAMACAAGNGRGECIATAWSVHARSDPAAALFWYSRTIEGDEARLQQCHGAHHIIGSSAGETNEIERSFNTELLEMWREAVREAIEETEYLPGGGE